MPLPCHIDDMRHGAYCLMPITLLERSVDAVISARQDAASERVLLLLMIRRYYTRVRLSPRLLLMLCSHATPRHDYATRLLRHAADTD